MSIFKADPKEGDIKNPELDERGHEGPADGTTADPPARTEDTAPADRQEPAEIDVPRDKKGMGVDRVALGKKFASRRGGDDIPFTGGFASEQARVGGLTREVPDETDTAAAAAADTGADDGADKGAAEHTTAAADPPARTEPPAQGERKFKLKVRRNEIELPEEQVIAHAQRSLAADTYLDEARDIYEEAKRLLPSDGSHPNRQTETADPPDRSDDTSDPSHPTDLKSVIEKIQYGTPEEGEEALRTVISQAKDPSAARTAVIQHFAELDLGKAKKQLADFQARDDVKEIVKDPLNATVMERLFYDQVRQDLIDLGTPADKLPADPKALVDTHRLHRVNGRPVRETAALLDASKQAFTQWKGGGGPKPPAPKPRTDGAVDVRVDRTERRASMPHQPQRASAPPPAQRSESVPRTRSAAVDKILKNRQRAIVA